jgi:hypothetical protein
LEERGWRVEPALRRVLANDPSGEVRRRVEQLLGKLASVKPHETTTASERRALRAVVLLEQIGNPEARRLLEALARGAKGARLTKEAKASLERLAKRHPAQ